ncbi:MAG: GNAT family N-acetyltransferase [Pirellulales bacterium]|nr:GNAT family N-acetyltransferase [Pirellulales bacterium]
MLENNLTLLEPCESLLGELDEFFTEFGDNPRDIDGLGWVPDVELGQIVQRLRDWSRGIDLPEGFVPSNTYWLVRDNSTILGTLSLRHRLNENLRKIGGHIGYAIRPSQRNKGYATRMLEMALPKARELGLSRVLVTCNTENRASARVIEKNGGVLEGEKPIVHEGKSLILRYYWTKL